MRTRKAKTNTITNVGWVENKGKGRLVITFDNGAKYRIKDKKYRKLVSENYLVRLNSTGTEIWSLIPVGAEYEVSFEKFLAPAGQKPVPVEKKGQYGPYYQAAAILKSHDPRFPDNVTLWLFYKFMEDDDGTVYVPGDPSSDSNRTLIGFLQAVGLWDQEVKYKDNLLPWFEKKASKEPFKIRTSLNDRGYLQIEPIAPTTFGQNAADEDEEDFDLPWEEED